MAKTLQKRPLVLLHKCPDCATFALKPLSALRQTKEIDSIQQRFSRIRLYTAPPTIEETDVACLGSSLDDNSVFEDDDNNLKYGNSVMVNGNSSSTSGLSSLDDSPNSCSDYTNNGSKLVSTTSLPKPAAIQIPNAKEPIVQISKSLRHRSISECEGISTLPLKGILKRRAIVRSMSECAGDNTIIEESTECLDSIDLPFTYSESGEDEESPNDQRQGSPNDQSPLSKKTVRFNDLVQRTLFRPNSSILGQKMGRQKKQQQQYQTKRKRQRSDSNVSDDVSEIGVGEGVNKDGQHQRTRVSVNGIETNSDKKSIINGSKRYAGFMIGHEPIIVSDQWDHLHRRHASGDSALGDDEGDCENNFSIGERVGSITLDSKARDSGFDDA